MSEVVMIMVVVMSASAMTNLLKRSKKQIEKEKSMKHKLDDDT